MTAIGSYGSKLLTADGEVGAAGQPVRIHNVHIISGGTAAIVAFNNNGASGTLWIKETGTISTGKTIDYGINGHLFPLGCYVDLDNNTTSVLVNYATQL